MLKLPQDALVIGAAARLEKQKRPDKLITIFNELKMNFPNLYLVLVGTGSLESGSERANPAVRNL